MTYQEALWTSRILEVLQRFDPRVVGTLPLDLAVATSDIDVVCEARDPNAFADVVWDAYCQFERFQLYRWREERRPAAYGSTCTVDLAICLIEMTWPRAGTAISRSVVSVDSRPR